MSNIRALFSGLLSLLIVGLTSHGPVTVGNRSELSALWFGFPLPYLHQDQAFWVNPNHYPYVTHFGSPYNYPWEFFWRPWIVDVAFFFLIIAVLQLIVSLVRHHADHQH